MESNLNQSVWYNISRTPNMLATDLSYTFIHWHVTGHTLDFGQIVVGHIAGDANEEVGEGIEELLSDIGGCRAAVKVELVSDDSTSPGRGNLSSHACPYSLQL